jgi:hypothetical protein
MLIKLQKSDGVPIEEVDPSEIVSIHFGKKYFG